MPHFSCEVNFFCAILHYKSGVIYQQLNIKYLKRYQFVTVSIMCHFEHSEKFQEYYAASLI